MPFGSLRMGDDSQALSAFHTLLLRSALKAIMSRHAIWAQLYSTFQFLFGFDRVTESYCFASKTWTVTAMR